MSKFATGPRRTGMTWQIPATAVAAFLISGLWYGVLGGVRPDTGPMTPLKVVLELLRSTVVATVLALACERMDVTGAGGALVVGLSAWVAFPAVLLTGSVLHDRVPWRIAALHAGDWLLKLVAISLIVTI
jgi:hypothetical protein